MKKWLPMLLIALCVTAYFRPAAILADPYSTSRNKEDAACDCNEDGDCDLEDVCHCAS